MDQKDEHRLDPNQVCMVTPGTYNRNLVANESSCWPYEINCYLEPILHIFIFYQTFGV